MRENSTDTFDIQFLFFLDKIEKHILVEVCSNF